MTLRGTFQLALALLIFAVAQPSTADNTVITVNLPDHTVDPQNPALNIKANDSVLINMKGTIEGVDEDKDKIFSLIDLPRFQRKIGTRQIESETDPVKPFASFGRQIAITFRACGALDFSAEGIDLPDKIKCGFAVLRDQNKASWVIFSGPEPILFSIRVQKGTEVKYAYSFPIQIESKPFGLAFSAGFAVLGVRDHRYRLKPIQGDDQNALLVRASDGSYPYQLSAFAHYMWLRHPLVGASVGVATEVPIEKITAMIGVSIALRTLPVNSTGYITIGGSYAQRQRLRAEFEGRESVPANLTSDALLEGRYGFGAFVALSFGFLGGEDKFKGVFSGGASTTSK